MSWMNGVSQCWPLANDCVVWWDAWAVVVAAIALLVAWLGLAVAGGSAAAVFWLGHQANKLGQVTRDVSEADRKREGTFILAYLYTELLDAYSSADAWFDQQGLFEYFPAADEVTRSGMLEMIRSISMPMTTAHFDRLHVLEPELGMRLARVLSTLELLRFAIPRLITLPNDAEAMTRVQVAVDHVGALRDDLSVLLKASGHARWAN